jgi:hypothetical protein
MYLCSNSEGTFLFENYPMRHATVNRKHVHDASRDQMEQTRELSGSAESDGCLRKGIRKIFDGSCKGVVRLPNLDKLYSDRSSGILGRLRDGMGTDGTGRDGRDSHEFCPRWTTIRLTCFMHVIIILTHEEGRDSAH